MVDASNDFVKSSRSFRRILLKRFRLFKKLASSPCPLLVVCAPPGSGKTTLARQYVEYSGGRAAFVAVAAGMSPVHFWNALDATRGASDVVIDDVDRLAPEDLSAFLHRLEIADDGRRFIVTAASSRAVGLPALIARGIAAQLPAELLAFDRDETAELATRLQLAHVEHDLVQLLHDTDGWPIAVDWIMRDAAAGSGTLRGAFDAWRAERARALRDFVEGELAHDSAALERARAFFERPGALAPASLADLDAAGFPIVRTRSGARPNRLLSALAARDEAVAPAPERRPLLAVTVLGRFRCAVGSTPLAFQRRRDQNVLVYVALARNCRVTRAELLEAFWPQTERSVAAQHLRTTLSRIRRAFADVVGAAAVDDYFRSDGDASIEPALLMLDARRFVEHVQFARIEEARNAPAGARHHYAAAEQLYAGRLLASELVEPCFAAQLRQLEEMYDETLARLVSISAAIKDAENAKAYGAQLLARATDAVGRRNALRLVQAEAVLA